MAGVDIVGPDLSAAKLAGNLARVEPDDSAEEEEPIFPWLPPDDRLWRHPSELQTSPLPSAAALGHTTDHRLWATALVAGMLGALVASGLMVVTTNLRVRTTVVRPVEQVVDTSVPATLASNADQNNEVIRAAAKLSPSLVEVKTSANGTSSTGSGVIFLDDGYVLTNSHVVQGATQISATLSDGHTVKAVLVGADAETDVAVLKLAVTSPEAQLGSAVGLKVGQMAIAIGNPLGLPGGPSVTVGVISALGREVESDNGTLLVDMIQTDAAIARGSSGGILVDSNGMVIGLITAFAQTGSGTGFATPIDVARDVAQQLMSTGRVSHAWIGVMGSDLDDVREATLGLDGGAQVDQVTDSSPAARAGLRAQDVITRLDGQPITSMADITVALRRHKPGDRVALTYLRGGVPHSSSLVVAERPPHLTS